MAFASTLISKHHQHASCRFTAQTLFNNLVWTHGLVPPPMNCSVYQQQHSGMSHMQAETGGSAGASHKGLVENLVEKAIEILPHQITGADPAPASTGTGTSAPHPYASGENARVGTQLMSCCHLFNETFFFFVEVKHAVTHCCSSNVRRSLHLKMHTLFHH